MSYEQQTQGSRRSFNDDANYDPSGDNKGTDGGGDSTLSGSHGGSGTGQAGGYGGNQGRASGHDQMIGNNFCDTDPGMAGNRGDTQSINVPGAGPMGSQRECDSYGETVGGQGHSRGYERDNDEYDDPSVGQGQGAGTGHGSKGTTSVGSKVIGGIEKMAGKISHKPDLEAKGEQRQSGF